MQTEPEASRIWDRSYRQGDNFVFYPHEEVVRFVSRWIRRRTGIDRFEDRRRFDGRPVGLDLGCGIGRHVRFMDDLGIEAHGIDLSEVAIAQARALCLSEGRDEAAGRLLVGSVTRLPYEDGRFDCIVSHGVLDSMPFETALAAMPEAHRVLREDGLFYLDLVSGHSDRHPGGFAGETRIEGPFEHDTIQSWFDLDKIRRLVEPHFTLAQCTLVRHIDTLGDGHHGRYHLVLRPRR